MTDTTRDGAGEGITSDDRPPPATKPHAHLLKDYDSEADCARGLDKSRRTLQRWHRLGIGPPRTLIGKTISYRRESVRDWLIAQEQAVRQK
ncbi:MAG: DNA-binding protein [Alphaproteobacteria bacterium]|nr:DNA-binding protein [Alphaproteobacteria bacterium]